MSILGKNEKYHKRIILSEEELATIGKQLSEFVQQQCNSNVYPIFSFSEYASLFSDSFAVCPMPHSQFIMYHRHDYYEINYILSGNCYQYINGNVYKMQANDLVLLSPQAFHTCYSEPGSVGLNILIESKFLQNLVKKQIRFLKGSFADHLVNEKATFYIISCQNMPNIINFAQYLKEVTTYSFGITSMEHLYRNSLINCILYALLTENLDHTPCITDHLALNDISTDENVLEYINVNIATVTLTELQNKFGFSRMGLYRFLKSKTGNTYTEYVGAARINYATKLLVLSDMPISRIAALVGFQSPEYFCRFFKKQFNMTPTEFRKSNKHAD